MADGTKIEWADASWNPIRARDPVTLNAHLGWHCEILTPGCENCYAQAINRRLGTGRVYAKAGRHYVEIYLDEKILAEPLRWRRPRRIFVCSMTDLFGVWVPDEMIDRVMAVAALCPQHTFLVLTKRAERMREYFHGDLGGRWCRHASALIGDRDPGEAPAFPLPNLYLGVSVEDQRRADERIPVLLATPAAVRWVSYEPALGPVTFTDLGCGGVSYDALRGTRVCESGREDGSHIFLPIGGTLSWAVIGGESGPGARPFDIEWARSTIAQCREADVACFVKQLGARPFEQRACCNLRMGVRFIVRTAKLHLRDRKGGDMAEWPEDLRVREYPHPS